MNIILNSDSIPSKFVIITTANYYCLYSVLSHIPTSNYLEKWRRDSVFIKIGHLKAIFTNGYLNPFTTEYIVVVDPVLSF